MKSNVRRHNQCLRCWNVPEPVYLPCSFIARFENSPLNVSKQAEEGSVSRLLLKSTSGGTVGLNYYNKDANRASGCKINTVQNARIK